MDVSAEAADVVVRESIQATEAAAKLALEGMKNVAALLLAIANSMLEATGDNCITLFTCVRDEREYRWCIRGVEM